MNKREEFDKIAREIFFPIYEVIAQDALKMVGKTDGTCLDVGCGGGHLGLSVARASQMQVVLLDLEEDALKIASQRIKDWGLPTVAVEIAYISNAEDRNKLMDEQYRQLAAQALHDGIILTLNEMVAAEPQE